MKKEIHALVLMVVTLTAFGQNNFDNYYPIISKGVAPTDFTANKHNRYKTQLDNLSVDEIKEIKKDRFLYAYLNSYSQHLIYQSGFVTFNDPISTYGNKILSLLLKDRPGLRKKIKVYLIKTTAVNAFTTNDGVIFISVGLMAQVQNEAQLAFVLAHEIIHYLDNHHIIDYINLKDALKKLDKGSSYDKTLQSLFSYSKQHELDADIKGFERFYQNSGYSIKEIENMFDVMLYSYLPFDEVEFDLDFFETENYIFPQDYKLEKYNEISAIENYDDSKSGHPNILKRRTQILNKISSDKNKGVKFQISEEEFNIAQEIARFELSYLYQISNNFEKAIYNSYLLLKKYPENKFLKTNIAESLYGLTFYKNRNDFKRAHIDESEIEGYSQQVFHLFEKMDVDELNLMALRYLWNLNTTYKSDTYISQMSDSLFSEISWAMGSNLNDFPLEKTSKVIQQDSVVDIENMSKIEKIKYTKKTNKKAENEDKYFYNALVDLPNKKELINKYEKYRLNPSVSSKRKIGDESGTSNYRRSLRNVKFGEKLGINKLVVFPIDYYSNLGEYGSKDISLYFKNNAKVVNAIKDIARQVNLEIIDLASDKAGSVNAEQINDYAKLSSWLSELNFQNNLDYIPATQKYISDLSTKYGTDYFAWIGINYSEYGSYELLIIDISTNRVVAYYNNTLPKKAFDFLKMNIYNSFFRIKSKKE